MTETLKKVLGIRTKAKLDSSQYENQDEESAISIANRVIQESYMILGYRQFIYQGNNIPVNVESIANLYMKWRDRELASYIGSLSTNNVCLVKPDETIGRTPPLLGSEKVLAVRDYLASEAMLKFKLTPWNSDKHYCSWYAADLIVYCLFSGEESYYRFISVRSENRYGIDPVIEWVTNVRIRNAEYHVAQRTHISLACG